MIEILKRYYPSFSRIEESEITYGGNSLGWHSTLFDSSSQIGSGCSQNKDSARRIATSEAIERGVFRELLKKEPKSFLLDEFPTTSGFAAGFEPAHVKHRAIAEAVERWAWSKWIDQDCLVEAASPGTREIGPLGSFFQGKFDEVLFFKKNFKIFAEGVWLEMQFAASVGLKDGGAFPGSRVCSPNESPWEHGLVEAWRHYLLSQPKGLASVRPGVYKDRIRFFSQNASHALAAIDTLKKNKTWTVPTLRLLSSIDTVPANVFVWRGLCANFKGWHLGSEKRFVF